MENIKSLNKHQHKHCYVYTFLQKHKYGPHHEQIPYNLLTDISGHSNIQNKKWLEQGLRMAYGYLPKSVKFQYDKYK